MAHEEENVLKDKNDTRHRHSTFGTWRATLKELYTRVITIDKNIHKSVYWNGENNNYPSEIERVISNSPTANRASKILGKYIGGKGVLKPDTDIIVNERKNYKISNICSIGGQNIAKQGGVWFHVGYGLSDQLTLVQKSLDIPDYCKFRKAKEDDEKNEGKIYYKDYADDTWFSFFLNKKVKEKWYYPYNPLPEVVMAQVIADYKEYGGAPTTDLAEMLPYYRGQVYYLNTTPEYKYALSPFDSVFNDMDSEYRISLYTNKQVRTGFLGKTAVLTQGLDDEQAKKVIEDVSKWLGAENSDTLYHLDVLKADDLDKVFKIIQVKGQYDEKLFEKTNIKLQSNILGSANSLPEILVLSGTGALFGASGETYQQAKLFFNEQTEDERNLLEQTINYLGFPCKIKPIVEVEPTPSV
jgi:hypothetical protein